MVTIIPKKETGKVSTIYFLDVSFKSINIFQ